MAQKIDKDALELAGYRRHSAGHKGGLCEGLWQKWICDGESKLYAVDFYIWDFSSVSTAAACNVGVEVRLYPKGGPDVDFRPLVDGMSLTDVEAFIARAYKALDCEPDRHNN